MVLKKIDGVESVEIKADGATTIAANKPLDMESVIKTLAEKGFNAVINK